MSQNFLQLQDGTMFGAARPANIEPYTARRRISIEPEEDEDEEELEELSGGVAAGGYSLPLGMKPSRPKTKKKNLDEIVNEFCNYLLHKLEE